MNEQVLSLVKSESNDRNYLETSKADAVETPAELAGKYRYVRELGHGAQAHVYEAVRVSDGVHVAIKELRVDSAQTWKEYDLFMREARVLQSLDMPGVAKFYEAMEFLDQAVPRAYIVQEFIDGESLADIMKKGRSFSIQRVFGLAVTLLKLLKELHTHQPPVIHRDIKPSNVLLKPLKGDEYQCYLIDFGAVANPQVQSGGSTVAGTYGYMPPEQLMGNPQPASDIYSLAVMLVYLISGVAPEDLQMADFRLVIEPHLQNVPQAVVNVLRGMLEPVTNNRSQDYDELIKAFSEFQNNQFSFTGRVGAVSQDLDKEIQKVSKLCQDGNIDIWQSLSDCTPREIPKSYKIIRMADIQSMTSIKKALRRVSQKAYFEEVKDKNDPSNVATVNGYSANLLIALFWGVFGGIGGYKLGVFFLEIANFETITEGDRLVWGLLGFIIGYIIVAKIAYEFGTIRARVIQSRAVTPKAMPSVSMFEKKGEMAKIHELIANGQKSIATIVDCEYLPLDKKMIESYTVAKSVKMESEENVDCLYYHGVPSYKLRYRFNPIDDDSPYDLIHEVIIHHQPAKNLVSGGALPILYYVNPADNSDVISMPYPYPLEDIIRLQDVFCKTISGKLASEIQHNLFENIKRG